MRAFWDKQIRQPWVLSVAGDFDREAVLAFARSLPAPQDAGLTVSAPAWGTERELAERRGVAARALDQDPTVQHLRAVFSAAVVEESVRAGGENDVET